MVFTTQHFWYGQIVQILFLRLGEYLLSVTISKLICLSDVSLLNQNRRILNFTQPLTKQMGLANTFIGY